VTEVVNELFPIFLSAPGHLPRQWQGDVARAGDEAQLARIVADYIAGMTDRFALKTHADLTGRRVSIAGEFTNGS
jgi:dGTPase